TTATWIACEIRNPLMRRRASAVACIPPSCLGGSDETSRLARAVTGGGTDGAVASGGVHVPERSEGRNAVHRHATELLRQNRIEDQLAVAGLQPEHRPQQQQRRRGRPGLRTAGRRIRNGKA